MARRAAGAVIDVLLVSGLECQSRGHLRLQPGGDVNRMRSPVAAP
jgi:hypothetical protein